MNQSGLAVSRILQDRDDEFLVVVDDVNLPLGKIRLRRRGSDGGHLGLRSIIDVLDTTNFWRLRIGIGQPCEDYARYVLRAFRRDEKRILNAVLREAVKGTEILIRDNFVKAQNYVNSVDLTGGYQDNRKSG
jgi:PTH1 family peptidyl-tRNA hydrolase